MSTQNPAEKTQGGVQWARDIWMVRFRKALDSREVAASSVESQRVHVREYVEYMHLLEGLHAVLHGDAHEDHE